MDFSQLLQLFFSGITNGSAYALIALGLVLLYKTTRVINLAHGEFLVVSGLTAGMFYEMGFSLWAALLFAVTITTVLSYLIERLAFRPFFKKEAPMLNIVIATVALSMILKTVARLVWGLSPKNLPTFGINSPIKILGAHMHPQTPWVIAITALTVVLLFLFLEKTLKGKALMACAENKMTARLMGINDNVMIVIALVIGGFIGALAGVILTPISYARYDFGILFTIKGFSAAIIGGLERPSGALLGGIIVGLLEAFGAGLLSAGFKNVIVLAVMLIVLIIKPEGIFGTRNEKV